MLTNRSVLLKCGDEEIVDFERPAQTKNRDLSRLLNDLSKVLGDDLEPVTPVVRATESGTLFDIFYNDVSIGFNAVRAFCLGTDLTTPEVVAMGADLNVENYSGVYGGVYEILLVGTVENELACI